MVPGQARDREQKITQLLGDRVRVGVLGSFSEFVEFFQNLSPRSRRIRPVETDGGRPLRQLAANAGCEGALIVEQVKNTSGNEGYNVATESYEDLIKAGVVDPTKVTRSALQNAASISGLLLTTECLIADIPEPEAAAEPHSHDHGMM